MAPRERSKLCLAERRREKLMDLPPALELRTKVQVQEGAGHIEVDDDLLAFPHA